MSKEMGKDAWSDTRLWRSATGLTATEKAAVSKVLESATNVLRSAGTSPLDFTLHDDLHGFRVAERMADLLGPSPQKLLTNYEAALALMSAYTHDIGMSPRRTIVKKHYAFLISGDKSLLTQREANDFQRWLDTEWNGLQPPIEKASITGDGLNIAEKILAYYCRYRHNDWSESWIREVVSNVTPGLYSNWIDDLVTLCRSHHEGLVALRSDRFEARIIGAPAKVVNLRFLAALLRVADVVEFDPKRTPEIILNHREISPGSRKYWQQDHEISFHLDGNADRIIFSARTPNAVLHRAVLDVAAMVNRELVACSALEHEGAFRLGKIPELDRKRYKWRWPSQVTADIQEKDQSFVFIDGAFRPDVKRVINLLSGIALYGSSMAALRELIQNATDAVREQIAYERLQEETPGNLDFSDTWSRIHKIRISLEGDDATTWLRCSDDGVGMTKDIIENHLLVSGSGARADIRALEREAEGRGFSVGRTGQFGIGVLSYFMIADYVEISTRRSAEAGDFDHSGWKFTTQGVGEFGELLKTSRSVKGTDIRLRLRSDLFPNRDMTFTQLCEYIASGILFRPCRIEIRDEGSARAPMILEPGWRSGTSELEEAVTRGMEDRYSRFGIDKNISNERREHNRRVSERWAGLRSEACSRLRWFGPRECPLPDKMGRIRLRLPYFELEGGESLGFLAIKDGVITPFPDRSDVMVPTPLVLLSWRGFVVSTNLNVSTRCVVEVDLIEGAAITVNRLQVLSVDDEINSAVKHASDELLRDFLDTYNRQPYWMLNEFLADREPRIPFSGAKFNWITQSDRGREWREVTAPLAEICTYSFAEDVGGSVTMGSDEIFVPQKIRWNDTKVALSERLPGGSVHFCKEGTHYGATLPCIVWNAQDMIGGQNFSCIFPRLLSDILYIASDLRGIVNAQHPYVEGMDVQYLNDLECDLFLIDENCCRSELKSAVIHAVKRGKEYWDAVRDNRPTIYERIISDLKQNNTILRSLNMSGGGDTDGWLVSFGPFGANEIQLPFHGGSIIFEDGHEIKFADIESEWLVIHSKRSLDQF